VALSYFGIVHVQPYQMVKDLRTGFEDSDAATVLDGDLDGFILSYLASQVQDSSPVLGAQFKSV
jgi:hypothetical protein